MAIGASRGFAFIEFNTTELAKKWIDNQQVAQCLHSDPGVNIKDVSFIYLFLFVEIVRNASTITTQSLYIPENSSRKIWTFKIVASMHRYFKSAVVFFYTNVKY